MKVKDLLKNVESFTSIRVVKVFSEAILYIGLSQDLEDEILLNQKVKMIRARDSTLIIMC